MKKCPRCGQICPDENAYCENCGTQLPEISRQSGKRNILLILVGCCAVAAIMIAVALFYTGINSENKSDTPVQTADTEPENPSVTLEVSPSPAAATPEPTDAPDAKTEEEPEPAPISYETYYVVNCQESITLRNSPSTKGGEICQIPFGSAVSYVAAAENGFYEIIYNGSTGYALAAYLDVKPQSEPPVQQPSNSDTYLQVVNCQESITLRKAPSTSADSFCQIPLGATVKYLEPSENGFCMVSYQGYTGYVLVSYLSVQ
ncbi:MAG: SH3 domain-containing protein [Ruminococcus sp.]|jgi:predicted nucleic acid-binding Zn ribbon protein